MMLANNGDRFFARRATKLHQRDNSNPPLQMMVGGGDYLTGNVGFSNFNAGLV
jgi:hypothetical protein